VASSLSRPALVSNPCRYTTLFRSRVVFLGALREAAVGPAPLEELDRGIEQQRVVQAAGPEVVRLLPQLSGRLLVPVLLGAGGEQPGLSGEAEVVQVRLQSPGDGLGGVGVDVAG